MTWSAFLVAMRNGVQNRVASASRSSIRGGTARGTRATSSQAAIVVAQTSTDEPSPQEREHDRIFWRNLNVRR